MAAGTTLPTSRHFQLHELAEGIYAAISAPGTGSGSNAGIIDLGGQTLEEQLAREQGTPPEYAGWAWRVGWSSSIQALIEKGQKADNPSS